MEKLTSFRTNDLNKLFQLAKKLNSTKFFEIFLNDYQYKIIKFILLQDSLPLWKAFLEGEVVLRVARSSDETGPHTANSTSTSISASATPSVTAASTGLTSAPNAAANDDSTDTDTLEEGHRPIKFLALHIRYLLWEKAIDFYYASEDLDPLVTTIGEVDDDYQLIDCLDDTPDENDELPHSDVSDSNRASHLEEKHTPAPAVIREEEDDYDDDDEDDDKDDTKEQESDPLSKQNEDQGSEDQQAEKETENNEEQNALQSDNKELKRDDENRVILEVPLSLFVNKSVTSAPDASTAPLSTTASVQDSSQLTGSAIGTPVPPSSSTASHALASTPINNVASFASIGTTNALEPPNMKRDITPAAGPSDSQTFTPPVSSASTATEKTSPTSAPITAVATAIAPSTSSNALEDQEHLIKEFNKVYHNFEYDRETLMKRRKLEKSDLQLEGTKSGMDANASDDANNMSIHLGSASTSLKHLLSKIQKQRDDIPINDYELRTLFMDVRKNRGKWSNDARVGQEELYEACEKVVLDLRGWTEHSTPFLNKVSKREAPNYGLIIKKPMDLNNILKKLKNLSYNSKKEFVDDLMLIWSNCLTYNADPKHYLRAHALAMQKRTLKLIPSIPDITIRSRVDLEKEEAELENNENHRESTPVSGSGKASKKGRKRTREGQVKTEDSLTAAGSPIATPRADTPRLSETPQASGTTLTQGNEELSGVTGGAGGEEEDEDYDGDEVRGENDVENEDEVDPELQAWRSLTAKSRAHYCASRAELFDENSKLRSDAPAMIRGSNEMSNFNHYLDNKQVVSKSSNLLENDEPYLLEYDITGGIPGLQYKGVDEQEEEKREQKLVDIFLQQSGGDPNKIKSNLVLPTDSGLNKIYFQNITEIQSIRKLCFKISLIRQMQTQQFVHHTQMTQPEIESIREVDVDPVSKLPNHDRDTGDVQYSVLRRNIAKIAMQTGFETTEPFAINTLAQVGETYLSNLIKSVKLHTESNSSNKLKDREILLLSLLENGVDKPDDLYTFVQERIMKQLGKLKDLRGKLSNFLKELLRPGLENFNERSFEDNSEQFMTGDFSNDLGDDFFGFKELGLDKEFKMLSSSIPIYLLHSRLNNSFNESGAVSKSNKYEDFKSWEIKKLSEADIDNQIGLLQPFYNKLLEKSKTHYIKAQRKRGEDLDLPSPHQLMLIEDEELPQKQRNIRPRLPPTGKISSIKKRIVANAFFLPDPTESQSSNESDNGDATKGHEDGNNEEGPGADSITGVKSESSSRAPVSPQKVSIKAS